MARRRDANPGLVIGLVLGLLGCLGGAFGIVVAYRDDEAVQVAESEGHPEGPVFVPDEGSNTVYAFRRRPTSYELIRLDVPKKTPTWSLPSTDDPQHTRVLLADSLYLLTANRLQAVNPEKGTSRWKVELPRGMAPACDEPCFAGAGSRLLVKAADDVLYAFDADTGTVAWQRKLVKPSAYIGVVNGRTLVVDDKPGGGGELAVLDTDGHAVLQLEPTCPFADGSGGDMRLNSYATVVPLPAENAALLGYGFHSLCWQRIDLSTGQSTWRTPFQSTSDIANNNRDNTHVSRLGNTVVVANGHDTVTVDVGTGVVRAIPDVPGTAVPIGMAENTVVIPLLSSNHTIDAVDRTSGQRTWSVDIGEAESGDDRAKDPLSIVVGSRPRFTATVDEGSAHVIVFDPASRELVVHNISLANGKDDRKTIPSGSVRQPPHFGPAGWRAGVALLQLDDDGLEVVDTGAGTISYSFP